MKKIITLTGSVSFYKDFFAIEKELNTLGYDVLMSDTALQVKESGIYNEMFYKPWKSDSNESHYTQKAECIRSLMTKIEKSNALLVVNLEKNGKKGYIGGNMLINMGLAFYLNKSIFIYNPIYQDSLFKEEILGMLPVIINRDLKKIKV